MIGDNGLPTDPATLMKIMPSLAAKFEDSGRRNMRYTPPVCDSQKRGMLCTHAAHYHEPSDLCAREDSLRHFGLKRDRKGASYFPQHTAPRPESKIPTRTQENIAACGAVGLSYWSEADGPNMLWAVDDNQRAHEVKIDRKAGKARAECSNTTRYDPVREWSRADTKLACTHDHGWHPWTLARTQDELSLQLEGGSDKRSHGPGSSQIDPISGRELNPRLSPNYSEKSRADTFLDEHVIVGHVGPSPKKMLTGKALINSATEPGATRPKDTAQQVAREAAIRDPKHATNVAAAALKVKTGTAYDACVEKPMSREQALALLAHDPDYLGDITNTALVDLLECAEVADRHPAIRDELRVNRGLSEKAS